LLSVFGLMHWPPHTTSPAAVQVHFPLPLIGSLTQVEPGVSEQSTKLLHVPSVLAPQKWESVVGSMQLPKHFASFDRQLSWQLDAVPPSADPPVHTSPAGHTHVVFGQPQVEFTPQKFGSVSGLTHVVPPLHLTVPCGQESEQRPLLQT
jgi:hypothetical protein